MAAPMLTRIAGGGRAVLTHRTDSRRNGEPDDPGGQIIFAVDADALLYVSLMAR
jgi:hypothetical protein